MNECSRWENDAGTLVGETVMTGAAIQSAESASTEFGQYFVDFTLRAEERELFANYTRANQGQFLTIVLDKQVISSPQISAVIEGQGTITGNFALEDAQRLALQLRTGNLPDSPGYRQHPPDWGDAG